MGSVVVVTVAAVVMAMAAAATKPASQPSTAPAEGQGVRGVVVKMVGDFMPSVGPGAPRGKRVPLAVPVHVFRGAVAPFDGAAKEHPAYVTSTKADDKGRYAVKLAAGKYTVVAEIEGKLYLNSYDGDGRWSTVEVKEGEWAGWEIRDTSGATF